MNFLLTLPEIAVVAVGLGLLLLDLWTPREQKRSLGYVAIGMLGIILAGTFFADVTAPQYAFGQMYVWDSLSLFFKRYFLVFGILVLVMGMDYADAFESGIVEYYSIGLFALAGMMWASSANDFSLLFVSVELMAVSFYVLVGFERNKAYSLEAAVKYLIMGAVASAFLVYGIAFVYGSSGALAMILPTGLSSESSTLLHIGLGCVCVALGFKIAAFPFQIWAPDVYQGSPTPTTAMLAAGSKAAGIALLLRVLFTCAPEVTRHWRVAVMALAGLTILYGNLCAIPQKNIKRLMGYSSIANAGYLLLGFAAFSVEGVQAVLFYLGGYLFALMAAFTAIGVALKKTEAEDNNGLAGLHRRSPLLAAALTLSMVSLAGVPPMAGFFGKFLLIKSVVVQGAADSRYYWLLAIALLGVVISLYYYLNVVRAIYWGKSREENGPIEISLPVKCSLSFSMAAMLWIGLLPNSLLLWAQDAAKALLKIN
jgi:NADH-quinone oxidoreductase subunit N